MTHGEEKALRERHLHVAHAGEFLHVGDVVEGRNPEDLRRHEVARDDPEPDALRDEQRHRDEDREHPRDDEVIDRMHPERAEGVDLLGHLHGADLRRDGGADAARHHETGEHRPELAKHRHRDHRADCGIHLQPVKLEVRLRGKDRAGEAAGHRHHELRAEAHLHHLAQKEPPADRRHHTWRRASPRRAARARPDR